MARFSEREGYHPGAAEITVREDAPADVRGLLVDFAYKCKMKPHGLRTLVCGELMVRETPSNWSEFSNVDGEVRGLLDTCPWYEVYDVVEAIYAHLSTPHFERDDDDDDDLTNYPRAFEDLVNRCFMRKGVGWKLVNGKIEMRGEPAFEGVVRAAQDGLATTGRSTAASEIAQALRDLSRRPEADVTGAIQHAIAALECVLRDVTGEKRTLGDLIARNRSRFPPPLDQALEKMWGFASERGRHLTEGKNPTLRDAMLVVHVASAAAFYLADEPGV